MPARLTVHIILHTYHVLVYPSSIVINLEDKSTGNETFSVGFARYLNVVHDVNMPPDQFHHCVVIISMTLAAILCSTLLIVTMTFERFYSIIMPHRAASFNTVNRAKTIILSIILFSIIFNIPQLFTSTNFGQLCVSFGTGSERTEVKIYYWLTFIIPVFIPFILLLAMNSVIIHTLRTRFDFTTKSSPVQGQSTGQGQTTKNQQSDKQIFILLLLVTFTFLILNTPVNVMIFYINYVPGNTAYYHAGVHLFYHVAEKAYFTNHAINFILYVLSGQKFRKDLVKLFQCSESSEIFSTSGSVVSTVT